MSSLRRLPSLAVLYSAASLWFVVNPTAATEIGLWLLVAGLAAWCISVVYTRRAWALRQIAGVAGAAALGLFVTARPPWEAVLTALIPVFCSALYFGPPGAPDGRPGWSRTALARAGSSRPPARLSCAVDGYLLIFEAVLYQFLGSNTAKLLAISVLLSATGLLGLGAVAAGGPQTVNDTRKALRAAGLLAQAHIAAHRASMPAIRIASGVVAAIYSVPATI